jgi:Flp pilus assembly protein TadD
MSSRSTAASFIFLFLAAFAILPAAAQSPTKPAPTKPADDYSQQPFVIERYYTAVRFESDGRGERELAVRIKVQSDAGVQQLGELIFGYTSENERLEIKSLSVRRMDGSTVAAGPEAVKDLTAAVARDAPVYTDFREKRATVPALRPGETLEYDVVNHVEKPLAPGQFWYSHDFLEGAIVLDERLEVNVPRDRAIQIKTLPGMDPLISEDGGRRIYRWARSQRELPADDDEAKKKKASRATAPAVQLTTFSSWAEVARWYGQLESTRTKPTPEIRAKALELTKSSAAQLDKIQALYDYVATNIRYVSLSFGQGRYQPHAAAEVLSNQYGDCKDKHTLLAAMLAAIGVHADAVLIPSSRKLDPDVPSPLQFDHVISAIPSGDGALLWLDSTAEVAPFQLLAAGLRHKKALLVEPDGAGRLVETPEDPPFLSSQAVEMEGQVSELGKLTAHLRYALRGDNELILRAAFRRASPSEWKELGQTILTLDGIRGEVTEVKASDPSATHQPFTLDLQFSAANFLDWSSKKARLTLPLPLFGMPATKEDGADPIELGSPLDVSTRLKLTLPPNYSEQPPVGVAVMRDYAEYRSNYKVDGNVFTAERSLHFRSRQLPVERTSDYLAFTRAVSADEGQELAVESAAAGTPAIPLNAKADELVEAGAAAIQGGNARAAVQLFQRVVEIEPKRKGAWDNLGIAYMRLGEFDPAAAAFRKQIEANPFDENAYDLLGLTLAQQQKLDEAAAAFRKQIEINPLDKTAHASLGSIEVQRRRYAEAVPELEKASVLTPDDAEVRVTLGRAYLELGQTEKALAAFDKGAELAPSPGVWNNVAYQLSLHKMQLDRAERYAESAVDSTGAGLRNVDVENLTAQNLRDVSSLASYWDTLGWVDFQRGQLDRAEAFIRASWMLGQHGEVGDHLGQIYERRGRKDAAIHAYALAAAAPHSVPETRARLAALLGGDAGVDALVKKAETELVAMRSISVGKLLHESATADFFVVFAPGPKVEAVRFIGGSDKLRAFTESLQKLAYPVDFPVGSPVKLIRRGTLACSAGSGACTFVLDPPESVFSVN